MGGSKRWMAVLALLAVVATACGSRLSEEDRATAIAALGGAGGSGDGLTGTTLPGGVEVGPSGGPATPSGGDSTGEGGSDSGTPGATIPGGGPATTLPGGGSTAASCTPGKATDTGVTGTTIELGNVSLISGIIQGFANTAVGATKAYVAYVNSLGGVCGHQLNLTVADDQFKTSENKAQYQRLKDKVFAFVGSLSVVDDGGVSVLEGTNIADVSLGLSDTKLALANNFSPDPIPPDRVSNNALEYARWMHDKQGITQYALLWPAQATARNRALGYRADYTGGGIKKAYEAEVAVTETNYAPHAAKICDSDPEHLVLTTTLEVNGMARLAKALKQQGCLPKFSHYGAQAYGNQFLELAGDAAEGARIIIFFDIIEGTSVSLTRTFNEWFRRVNPGLEPDFFAIESWIATDMLVTAMRNAGGDLTRDRLMVELKKLKGYTAGGMTAAITPGTKTGPHCFMVAKVQNGAWQRDIPEKGFIC